MQVSRGARRLFQLIKSFVAKYRREFFASQGWIAKTLGSSLRSVQRWTQELIRSGCILQRRRSQMTAVYSIRIEAVPAKINSVLAGQMAGQMAGRNIGELPTEVRMGRKPNTFERRQNRPSEAERLEELQRQYAEADRLRRERGKRAFG